MKKPKITVSRANLLLFHRFSIVRKQGPAAAFLYYTQNKCMQTRVGSNHVGSGKPKRTAFKIRKLSSGFGNHKDGGSDVPWKQFQLPKAVKAPRRRPGDIQSCRPHPP